MENELMVFLWGLGLGGIVGFFFGLILGKYHSLSNAVNSKKQPR